MWKKYSKNMGRNRLFYLRRVLNSGGATKESHDWQAFEYSLFFFFFFYSSVEVSQSIYTKLSEYQFPQYRGYFFRKSNSNQMFLPRPRVCCCQASHQRSEFWAPGPARILSQIAIRWGFNPNGKNNVLVKSAVITNTVYILWTSNDYIFHSHKQGMQMNALCDRFRRSN